MNIFRTNDRKHFELDLPWVDLLVAGIFGAVITAIVMFFISVKED